MSRRALLLASLTNLLVLLGVAAPVAAQKPMTEKVKAAGTIKEATMGLLHVVGAGGTQWLVKVDAKPQDISFMGSADETWLQPGMLIRFTAIMDRRGKIDEPLTSISVVSMRPGYVFGVTQEGLAVAGNNGPKLFEDPKPEKPVVKKPAGPIEPMPVLIIGRIASIKHGKMTIDAGTGKQLKIELEEKAKITVDVADLSWARAGDKIEIDGWAYPQQKSNVFANTVTVTASNPLTHEKKRPTPAAKDGDKKDPDKDGEKDSEKKGAEKKS